MIGTYRCHDGCTYEVFTVETGKGKVKTIEYRMRCLISETKDPSHAYPVTPEQIEYLLKVNSFQSIHNQ
jgi:hypothetical protein